MKKVQVAKVVVLDQMLTTREVATLLSKSDQTVIRWVKDGRLPARKSPSGSYLYRLEDVEAVLEPVEVQTA